jgi:hypothetical protein
MPTQRIPLVGSFNQRTIDGTTALNVSEDQRFLNCIFNVVRNPVTGKGAVYLEKRPGWQQESLVSSGLAATGLIKPQSFNAVVSAFGETSSVVYVGTESIGTVTRRVLHFSETAISAIPHVLFRVSDGSGWYYPDGSKDTLTYTGHTSTGIAAVSTIADVTGIYPGQKITGNTIGSGARVLTVDSATSTITLSVTSSANSTGAILTKEPIALIMDSNFVSTGTYVSNFVPLDGYQFYVTDDGYIQNSDLNTVTSYTALGRRAVQQYPDPPIACATQNNAVVVFGLNSKEVFQNAGRQSGSPLVPVPQFAQRIGCLDQRSVTQIEDEIYFVASPSDGDVGVYRMKGLAALRISTANVDRILGTAAASGAIYASAFRMGGYKYAVFTASLAQDGPDSELLLESGDSILLESGDIILLEDVAAQTASFVRQLVYNIDLNVWSEWNSLESTFVVADGAGTKNRILAASRFKTDGKIYSIDPLASGVIYTDDGTTISTEVRTAKLDFGTNEKKYVEEVRLIADTQSTGSCTLYYSDDDYQTWSAGQTIDLTSAKKSVYRLGAHRGGRAYRLLHTAAAPFRAEALEIVYRKGLS